MSSQQESLHIVIHVFKLPHDFMEVPLAPAKTRHRRLAHRFYKALKDKLEEWTEG